MADDIRSRAGLSPREEAARRRRDGEARRAAAREALSQDQMRERTMREMEQRRAAPPRPTTRELMDRQLAANAEPRRTPQFAPPGTYATGQRVASAAARGASRAVPGMNVVRGFMPTTLEPGAEFEREGLRRVRAERMAGERAAMDQEMGEAGSRMPTPRPAARPAPARGTARAAPAARREISADRLNDLMMGAEPATAEERVAQMRMRGRQQELEGQGTAFKKGGMVKPKKMMKGGIVAKPKAAAKSKPKPKPMPFKKGGMIKKGRK
jgi:hypothetical protein